MQYYTQEVEWIELSKLKPKVDGPYLVSINMVEKPLIMLGWYDPRGFGWSLIPAVLISSITHWMELPRPPERISS